MMSCWKLSLRFLSQWEMNGGVKKEDGIIIWLSSQDQTVKSRQISSGVRRETKSQKSIAWIHRTHRTEVFIWFYFSGHLNVPNECL